MPASAIENRHRGADLEKLPDSWQRFCLEMIASERFQPTEAARKAGYKHPAQAAQKLMKHPRVKAFLGKVKREREERTGLTADEMLQWMHDVIKVNPLTYFRPGDDGWLIDEDDLRSIPEWVGRLIVKMKKRTTWHGDDKIVEYQVTLVDKATIAPLLVKHHCLTPVDNNGVNVIINQIDWSQLAGINDDARVIEGECTPRA
ncbi:MAG TPA: terminase small subunit [Planctomycetaceae bacterium]|nr:terminase small subunit [Planctomycetaceae bacterium]